MTDTQVERPAESLYLLGHPIAHSSSPTMYNAVYERLGLPWRYGLADCATEEEARSFVEARGFLSINITTPYKPLAFEAATAKAATVKLAQGANVLVKKGDALIGFNTDGQGCVAYLERTGFCFAGKRVAVCGTGPTSTSDADGPSSGGPSTSTQADSAFANETFAICCAVPSTGG